MKHERSSVSSCYADNPDGQYTCTRMKDHPGKHKAYYGTADELEASEWDPADFDECPIPEWTD